MTIKTDSTPVEDPKDPDGCNVFQLYRLVATPDETAALSVPWTQGPVCEGGTLEQTAYAG